MSPTATANLPDARGPNGHVNVAVLLIRAFSTSVEVVLHQNFGERYLGLQAAAVLLVVPGFTMLFQNRDPRPLLLFVPVYCLFCLVHRAAQLMKRVETIPGHSYYNGLPILVRCFPRLDESVVKRFIEPALVYVAGFWLRDWNEPLGVYLIVAAICLFGVSNATVFWERQRALDLNDAVIGQQSVAERFRGMRGGR